MPQWRTYTQPPRQGTSHRKRGNSPCQDIGLVKENDEIIVAVLADGLGQLEYSRIAAAAATEAVAALLLLYDYKTIETIDKKQLIDDVLGECEKAINRYSDSLNVDKDKMDCTLIFVVFFKNGTQLISGQLGDGAICIIYPNRAIQVSPLESEPKATANQTMTVLSKKAKEFFSIQIHPADGLVGVFLTTDGLENEIYSKAGNAKKNIEWYFNLISNETPSFCETTISKRWDELTSDEKYGFTDDMSLVAIVLPNTKVELPNEVNWLCVCGNRNRVESTRCEKCGKDFTKVYRDVNIRQNYGSRLLFFTRINSNPQEELEIIRSHSDYPIEFAVERRPEWTAPVQQNIAHAQATNRSQKVNGFRSENQDSLLVEDDSKRNNATNARSLKQDGAQTKSVLSTPIPYSSKKKNNTKNKKVKVAVYLVLFLLVFIAGFGVRGFFNTSKKDRAQYESDISELLSQIDTLNYQNDLLNAQNEELTNEILLLNNLQEKSIILPDRYEHFIYDNGDMYIGEMRLGLPDGMGVLLSDDYIAAGFFQHREKNGDFLFMYSDGRANVMSYKNDDIIIDEPESSKESLPHTYLEEDMDESTTAEPDSFVP